MDPSGRRQVRIAARSDRVVVRAETRDDVVVDGPAEVRESDDEVVVDADGAVTVRVPEGSAIVIGAMSGRVDTHGRLGNVRIVGQSGRVVVESADEVDVRTSSGRVDVGEVGGMCTARTESARIQVATCGSAAVSTKSGRIDVRGARGPVHAHCVSGRVSVTMERAADVVADSVSGRVSVSFPAGVRYRRIDTWPADAIGDALGSGIEASDEGTGSGSHDCTVAACSVSGGVEVTTR